MFASARSWLLPLLAGSVLVSGLVACTAEIGPGTDTGNGNIADDDDDDISSSSSSSSGTVSSSSSSSGAVSSSSSSGGTQATCEIDDVVELSDACLACTDTNCSTQVQGCFKCGDATTGVCDEYLDALIAACDQFTDETEFQQCADATAQDHQTSAAAYDLYNTCQQDNCATECGLQ